MGNATQELLRKLRSGCDATQNVESSFREGEATGTAWAQNNIFGSAQSLPLTLSLLGSPYNIGVMHGIAQELRRAADRVDPTKSLGLRSTPQLLCSRAETHVTPHTASFVSLEDLVRCSTIDTEA